MFSVRGFCPSSVSVYPLLLLNGMEPGLTNSPFKFPHHPQSRRDSISYSRNPKAFTPQQRLYSPLVFHSPHKARTVFTFINIKIHSPDLVLTPFHHQILHSARECSTNRNRSFSAGEPIHVISISLRIMRVSHKGELRLRRLRFLSQRIRNSSFQKL